MEISFSSTVQLYHNLMQVDAPMTKILPELVIRIFSLLTVKQVVQGRLVCKQWNILSRDQCLWEWFFKRDFPNKFIHEECLFIDQYINQNQILQNWNKGRYLVRDFVDSVGYELSFVDKHQVIGFKGSFIRSWNKQNRSIQHTWEAHPGGEIVEIKGDAQVLVSYAHLQDNRGFTFGQIKIWDKNTALFLYKAESGINFMIDDNRLIIEHLEIDNKTQSAILNKLDGKIVAMLDHNIYFKLSNHQDYISSAYPDGSIKTWKKADGTPIVLITEKQNHQVSSILIKKKQMITGDFNGMIKIWDLDKPSYIQQLEDAENTRGMPIYSLIIDGDLLIAKHKDKDEQNNYDRARINIWDKKNGLLLYSVVTSLISLDPLIDEDRLITISNDTKKIEIRNKYIGSLLPISFKEYPEGYPTYSHIKSMLIDDDRLIILFHGRNAGIRIWNKHSGALLISLETETFILDNDCLFVSLKYLPDSIINAKRAPIQVYDFSSTTDSKASVNEKF